MKVSIEKMLPTDNPFKIILWIASLFLAAWIVIRLDKYLRVKILIWTAQWQRVDNFMPGRTYAYSGVYIWQKKGRLFWHTVYVGQSINVRRRFYQHISGKGSPDIYREFRKSPEKLRFKSINARKAHYKNLDALEKRLIDHYHTYYHGFNKTAGNGHRHY